MHVKFGFKDFYFEVKAGRKKDDKSPLPKDQNTYILSETCQIPELPDIYKLFFGFKRKGFFVECGAYNGETASNTSGLADIGWEGLYIEPIQEYYETCKERHKNNQVSVIHRAVGDENKMIQISKAGLISTIQKEKIEKFNTLWWSKGHHKGNIETVQQEGLNHILARHNVPKGFDILSIDAEGYEWTILKDFDIKRWQPKMVLVELHDVNPQWDIEWDESDKIISYFEENHYRVIYKDLSNTIYLRKDIRQRKAP